MSTQPAVQVPTWGEGDGQGGGGTTRLLKSQTVIQGGDTIANTNVVDAFASSALNIPANTFSVGSTLTITAVGTWHTAAAAPTLETAFALNGTAFATTGAVLELANILDRGWQLVISVTCTSIGATGTLEIQGARTASTGATAARTEILYGGSLVINTTAAISTEIQETWNTADPDNSITMRQFSAVFSEVSP